MAEVELFACLRRSGVLEMMLENPCQGLIGQASQEKDRFMHLPAINQDRAVTHM